MVKAHSHQKFSLDQWLFGHEPANQAQLGEPVLILVFLQYSVYSSHKTLLDLVILVVTS